MKKTTLLFSLLALSNLAQANTSPAPEIIIDGDTRVRVTEKNHRTLHDSIGLLKITSPGGTGYCTGTVIGTNHVVTAAHCLVDNNKFVDKVEFIPGINGHVSSAKRPFGTFRAVKFQVFKAYFTDKSTDNDLGLLKFAENLPVSPLRIAAAPSSAAMIGSSVNLTIAGYPGDKAMGTLWEGRGYRYGSILWNPSASHNVDTAAGQSGSAVRAYVSGKESVVGVHSGGVSGRVSSYNEAKFFTEGTIAVLKKWMAQ